MGKSACKDKKYQEPALPEFRCKKCGAKSNKENKLCKPQKTEKEGPLFP